MKKTEKTKKVKMRKPPTAVLVAIIAALVLVSVTLAWLTVGDALTKRIYSLSNFDANAAIYFDGATVPLVDYRNPDGTLNIDVTDTAAENYIGKLRVDANYKGRGAFYLRLKMVQQWTGANGKVLQTNAVIPYTIGGTLYDFDDDGDQAAWFDNRLDDFSLYYAKKIQTLSNTTDVTIQIITGIDMNKFNAIKPADATLKVAFTLEAVQVNRYPQFWGMDTLPWRN